MKITLGFGIIIFIMLILGSLGVVNMSSASSNSYNLAKKHAPEVDVSTRVERNVMQMMYTMRGYNFTGGENFLKTAKDELAQAKQRLADAEALSEKYPELTELKKGIEETKTPLLAYEKLINDTENAIAEQNRARDAMNAAAREFMESINTYLKDITKTLIQDMRDGATGAAAIQRVDMITQANDIIDLGNGIRIANFKSQALRDYSGVKEIMKNFSLIDKSIDELMKKTRTEKDRKKA